jgi:hypothetical protein
MQLAQEALRQLPIKVSIKLLKGHTDPSSGPLEKMKDITRKFAKHVNGTLSPASNLATVLPPTYNIELVDDNKVIAMNLALIITARMHKAALQTKIIRDTGWTDSLFSSVDWEAIEAAFLTLNRFRRISICKLVYCLVHTHEQGRKYYGTTDNGPC